MSIVLSLEIIGLDELVFFVFICLSCHSLKVYVKNQQKRIALFVIKPKMKDLVECLQTKYGLYMLIAKNILNFCVHPFIFYEASA